MKKNLIETPQTPLKFGQVLFILTIVIVLIVLMGLSIGVLSNSVQQLANAPNPFFDTPALTANPLLLYVPTSQPRQIMMPYLTPISMPTFAPYMPPSVDTQCIFYRDGSVMCTYVSRNSPVPGAVSVNAAPTPTLTPSPTATSTPTATFNPHADANFNPHNF